MKISWISRFAGVLASLASFALASSLLYAQATTGTITGQVTDPSGAAVRGAKVTLTEVNKGVSFAVTSNELGYYTKALLPPGAYTLKVEIDGFKTFVRENVLLSVDSTVRVDASLELGQVVEKVVVTAEAPLLKSERGDVSTLLPNRLISELPTIGRNVALLQLLTPGAVKNWNQVGLAENPQGSVNIITNGQPNGARNMMLDGVDNNENVLGGNVVIPTAESVREIKISTSSWDAEFGRAGGAVSQVETKSGDNALHGSWFHFLRNDVTNARNSLTEPKAPPPFKWNQFGGSLGGPIQKNKTFFFGDYQGARQRLGNTVFANLPTAPMRQGDFSQLRDSKGNLIPIFDPQTGDASGAGRLQFADNRIPTVRISPVAKKLMDLLPAATYSDRIENNFIAAGSTKFNTNQFSTRVDHFLGENTRLFGRYIYFGSDLFSPPIYGLQGGGPALQGGVGGFSRGFNQNLSLNLNHIFRPTLLIDVRYGYSHYRVQVRHPDEGTDLSNQVGIPGINQGNVNTSGLVRINATGIGAFSMGGPVTCNCPLDEVMSHHQAAANVSWIKGSHSIKFGGDIRRYHNLRVSNNGRRGTFEFRPGVTGNPSTANSGFGTASLLLGLASSFTRQFNYQDNIGNESETHVFGYVQDTWKVTPKLTLNYGVRYEIYTPPATPTGAGSNLEFPTMLVWIAGVGDVPNRVGVRVDKNNFAPRFGLSYRLNDKTVIRLGAARSFFPNVFNVLVSGNYPLIGTQQLNPAGTYNYLLSFTDPRPAFTFPAIPPGGKFALPVGVSMTGNPFNRATAYVDAWNLTVQRTVSPTLSVETAYVGNVGRQLYFNVPMNVPVPGPGPFNPRRPLFAQRGFTQDITVRGNSSSSSFHSLQIQVQKRATRDLAFIAAYCWSKTMDFGAGDRGYDVVSDPYHIGNDRAVANRDRASVFTLGHVYEFPFGRGKRFLAKTSGVANHIVGGWSFNGITIVESGLPISPALANNAPLNSTFLLRPDIVGNPEVSNPSRNLWFNPAAFVVPGQYRQGTTGRNILRGPSFFEANWALSKLFQATERTRLEFRWEVYNAFNTTNLANPTVTVDSPAAGKIFGLIAGSTMRQMQFGLRLSF